MFCLGRDPMITTASQTRQITAFASGGHKIGWTTVKPDCELVAARPMLVEMQNCSASYRNHLQPEAMRLSMHDACRPLVSDLGFVALAGARVNSLLDNAP